MGVAAEPLSRSAPSRLTPHRALGDSALARLVSRGDERAFETLYHRYRDQLHRYCGSILRQSQDAEEAFQATMLNAYRALLAGERDVAMKPWLYRIAHNQCISLLRRRSNHEELSGLEESVGGRVDERAEVSEDLRQLRVDLAQLPDQQRSALVLRELSGLSHDAIAEALDTTPAGAKQLIYEARQTLQEFGEGRSLSCTEVRKRVSDGDGRLLRARRVKAHLRACAGCTRFQSTTLERPTRLAALAPVLPAIAAQRILEAVLTSVGGGSGAAVLAGAAGGSGAGVWATGAGGAAAGAGGGGAAAGGAAAGAGAAAGGAAAGAGAGAGAVAGVGAGSAAAGLGMTAGASVGAGLGGFAAKAAVVGAVALVGGSAAVVPMATQALRGPVVEGAALVGSRAEAPAGGLTPLLAAAGGMPDAAAAATPETAPANGAGQASGTELGPPIGSISAELIAAAATSASAASSPIAAANAPLADASTLADAAAAAVNHGQGGPAFAAAVSAAADAAARASASTGIAAGAGAIGSGSGTTANGEAPTGAAPGGRPPAGSTLPAGTAGPSQPSAGSPTIASVVRSTLASVTIPIVSGVVSRLLPGSSPTGTQGTGAQAPSAATEPATEPTGGAAASEPTTTAPSDPAPTSGTALLPDASTIVNSLSSALAPLVSGLTGGTTTAPEAPAAGTSEPAAPTSTAPTAPDAAGAASDPPPAP